MSDHPFHRFDEQLAAATDDAAARRVAGEIGRWRAAHLTDVPALRDAAWAMSHVLATIGDQAGAVREAQALVSLCRTSPPAPEAGLLAALDRVADLTGAPRIAAAPRKERKRKERKERPERPERPERSAGDRRAPPAPELDPVVAAADAGQFEDAFAALRGRRGPRAQLRRVYARLSAALAEPDVAARDAALDALRDNIRRLLVGEPPDAAAPQRAEAPPPTGDDPLSKLLGRPAPRRRKALIELIEAYADENPGQLDELAATALRHHVEGEGLRAPAPWLVGLVGRALATGDAPLARAAVAELRSAGAFAVTAYEEPQFAAAVQLVSAAQDAGWDVTSLRRGVLAKIEPADHRVWTVRLIRDFVERMVAIADPRAGAHDAAAANQIAARIVGLCPRSVLVAPGPHNAALRDAAPAHGLAATEDLGAALALAEALVDAPAPTPAERPEKPTAREPRGPSPVQLLRDAVEAGADVDALVEILAPLRQRFRAFKPIRTAIDTLSPAEADSRVVAVLEALRRTATEDERLPEGVTVAIRMSALAPGGATAEWLAGPGAERFGGPGIDRVTGVAAALEAAGWRVGQVLHGPTGRELRDDPALDALGRDTGGLWRVRAKRNEVRGEVWYCQDLTPEGRGIAARLALQEGARAVIAADEDLGAWLATLPGVEPIAWSEDAPAAAVGGLPDAPAEG